VFLAWVAVGVGYHAIWRTRNPGLA